MLSALHFIMIDRRSLSFVTYFFLSHHNKMPRYETLLPYLDKIAQELKIFALEY